MPATQEEFALRLQQLERDFQELMARMSQPHPALPDLAEQISFRAWMRISAPTFAVLVAGFTLLWNAQQATYEQSLETSRALGRLDGAVASLEKTTARLDDRMDQFDRRLAGIDERLAGIDQRLAGIDTRLDAIDGTLGTLGSTVGRLAAAVEKLEARL